MKFTTQVIKGQGRGKALGYPTFNLKIPVGFKAKLGIYAGSVWVNNKKYLGAFHFGPIPVFNESQLHLEVFVLDYEADVLVTAITFELVHYLRPIRNFPNPAALARRISLDVAQVRATLS